MYIQNEFNDLSNWALQSNVGGYSGSEKKCLYEKINNSLWAFWRKNCENFLKNFYIPIKFVKSSTYYTNFMKLLLNIFQEN